MRYSICRIDEGYTVEDMRSGDRIELPQVIRGSSQKSDKVTVGLSCCVMRSLLKYGVRVVNQ